MKEQYVNDSWTGEYDGAGFKDIRYLVQVNMKTWRDEEGKFGLTVKNCRHNAGMAGLELIEPMNTFQYLASEIFPETLPEDWE